MSLFEGGAEDFSSHDGIAAVVQSLLPHFKTLQDFINWDGGLTDTAIEQLVSY